MTLAPYAGRWIARNQRNDIVGVGDTPQAALAMARAVRPKEHFRAEWVTPGSPHVAWPEWLVRRVLPHLPAGRIWLVGGVVRDLILGRPHHDWDFVMEGDASSLARLLGEQIGGAYVPLDEERGIVRLVVPHLEPAPVTFDFATLRGASLVEDLNLRDFTINAMAMDLTGALIDPLGGMADLQAGCVRRVSPRSFEDDPLRMLRAVRVAAELNFRLDDATVAQIRSMVEQIRRPAVERVTEELLRILRARPLIRGLDQLHDLRLLEPLLPEIAALASVTQSAPHYQPTVWGHVRVVLQVWEALLALLEGRSNTPPADVPEAAWTMLERSLSPYQPALIPYLRDHLSHAITRADAITWAVLFHDAGKTLTRSVDAAGRVHFYGHAEQGAKLARLRLEHLRFPLDAQTFIATLVAHHMDLIGFGRRTPLTRRAIYRFFRHTGEAGVGVALLSLVDVLGVMGPNLDKAYWQERLELAQAVLTAYFERDQELVNPVPLLNGHDLQALGVPAGPRLGALLAALREAQAAGDITTRDEAEAYVRAHLAT